MEARQFSLPQHLAAQCSDKILMHINRPSNFQQTIDLSFEDFSQGLYTDVTLVTDDGVKTKIHGFLLSAASPFLCDVFNNTFSPNLEYCILLPEVSSSVVSCLAQLLYGATVITCRDTLVQLYRLVDILAIQLSLVTTRQELEETRIPDLDTNRAIEAQNRSDAPDEVSLSDIKDRTGDEITDISNSEANQSQDNHKNKVETNPVKMLKVDDKNNIPSASPVAEVTVGQADADGSSLPLCCWHCSLPFPSFPSLSSHQCCSNTSSPLYKRHHRCPQCGDLLSSMWRLRQHLATHQPARPGQAVGGSSSDHPYGRSSRRVQPSSVKVKPGDHGYATATLSRSAVPVLEPAEGTPPGSAVHSEHSYGTKRDSSPEDEQRNSFEKTDHIYSAATSETGKDNPKVDDVKSTGREDHQYFQHSERSSPRFRKLLPKEESFSSSKLSTAANFPCSICDKSFPQAYRLKRHIREVHDKEKMFKCEECNKKFFKSNSLVRHKIAVHDKIRPFSCPNCDSRFKDRSALKYHTKKNVCILK
eukprot:TRINITY_DN8409_c0_g1_i1.p1 TRINITY_DN8409_c0_g1~~TRINITY_DN8409_c0_g1_i1.p1  ORF type:complete len:531 (-),score=145.31 TRINITY_DN8409_c0_g1_i1:76-1668(-)